MSVCHNCKDDRKNNKRPARPKKGLPVRTKHRDLVVEVCVFCDGPAYDQAVRSSKHSD